MSDQQRDALAALARLPYFVHYDIQVDQAIWGVSEPEGRMLWQSLTAMQLVQPAQDDEDYDTMPWLVRDFARQKSRSWTWGRLAHFALWRWRYRLSYWLRWWWPSVPTRKSRTARWRSPGVPGTADHPGWRSIFSRLTKLLWRPDGGDPRLQATPPEWVLPVRSSMRFLSTAALAGESGLISGVLMLQSGRSSWYRVAASVAPAWSAAISYVDLRRTTQLARLWRRSRKT